MTGPLEVTGPLDMTGRAVIVTGGCKGIGHAIATRFLEAGAKVVVCCRHAPEEPPASVGADGRSRLAHFVQADVRKPEQVDRVVGYATKNLGRLDVLVNNAGGSPPADAATASRRFSASVVELNLLAPLYFSQQANAVMQEQPEGGCIVNIASISGLRPSPGTAAYGAAKAGLINLTQSLAIEWAPKVRVNAVSAGLVQPHLQQKESSQAHYGDDEGKAAVAATVPLGRMADPADVANACLFLASPLASYMSGANLVLHGGGEKPAFLATVEAATRAKG